MPLTRFNNGTLSDASQADQYFDLLTGVITDQPVTLSGAFSTAPNGSALLSNVSVTSTATLLPASPLANRSGIRIWNPAGNPALYIGFDNTVTAAAAVTSISAGENKSFDLAVSVYGILAAGTAVVQIEEIAGAVANRSTVTKRTVGTAATALPLTAMANRRLIRVWNLIGNSTVYVGYANSVTAGAPLAAGAQGVPIVAGGMTEWDVGSAIALWGIVTSGTAVVFVEEEL